MAVARSSNSMHPAIYRSYQFFAALKASLPGWAGGQPLRLTADDAALVETVLSTAPQRALFERMPPNDRRHAVAVGRTLQVAGFSNTALLQAGFLHDAGKSIGQPIVHRVLIVLFEAFWPAALNRLSRLDTTQTDTLETTIYNVSWWRRPFVVHAHHPRIGADWATAAGCSDLAVQLILHHQQVPPHYFTVDEKKLLTALQWADNLN
jgi:hypothetical protein